MQQKKKAARKTKSECNERMVLWKNTKQKKEEKKIRYKKEEK